MKIAMVASQPHYLEHMRPIFDALPDELKHGTRNEFQAPPPNVVAMVAGWADVKRLRGVNRMIYVEHGAGQTYAGDERLRNQPGYSGSRGLRHTGVIGFISPSQEVADRWTTAPSVAVGCPKLDRYIDMTPAGPPSVCFAWHWDCTLGPETRSAFSFYRPDLPSIVDRFRAQGFGVYGHAHPKWEGRLNLRLAQAGMTVLPREREVFETASLLFVDNSSLGAEFMALNRPVVWLNAPWYRRAIEHGGRFWSWTRGIPTVDGPEDLMNLNIAPLLGDQRQPKSPRNVIADSIYAHRDGLSSVRAAQFIAELIAEM